MNIADKIIKFDNIFPANVQQFEDIFDIKISEKYKKNELVEILEPITGGLRKVLIGNDVLHIDLNPTIDGSSQDSLLSMKRKLYRYILRNEKGNIIAEGYSAKEIADSINVTSQTIRNIISRGDGYKQKKIGRKGSNFTVERIKLTDKEISTPKKAKKRFVYEVYVKGEKIGVFNGVEDAAVALGLSKGAVSSYLNRGNNKKGIKIVKSKLDL